MSRIGCTHPSQGSPLLRTRRDRLHCGKRGTRNKVTYKVSWSCLAVAQAALPTRPGPGRRLPASRYMSYLGIADRKGVSRNRRARGHRGGLPTGLQKLFVPSRVVGGHGQGTRISQSVEQRLAAVLDQVSARTVEWDPKRRPEAPARDKTDGFKCCASSRAEPGCFWSCVPAAAVSAPASCLHRELVKLRQLATTGLAATALE